MPAFFGDGYGVVQAMIGDALYAQFRPGPLALLLALPLCALVMNRVWPSRSARRALLELGLVCGPWVLLLWCGWPSDASTPLATWIFIACVACALGLHDPRLGMLTRAGQAGSRRRRPP